MSKIHMDVEIVREIIRSLQQAADDFYAKSTRLQQAGSQLSVSWQGSSSEDYQHRYQEVLNQYNQKISELESLVLRASKEVDEWVHVDQSGKDHFSTSLSKSPSLLVAVNPNERLEIDWHSEYHLLAGREIEAYEGYLETDNFDEAVNYLQKDHLKEYPVKTSITFYEAETSGKYPAWDGQAATQYGNFGGSLASAEYGASTEVVFEDGAFQAQAKAEGGVYAAKGTYNADVAGFGVAAVGFIGAEACGTAALAFDPAKGEIGVKAGVEGFAGGKVEGSVSGKGEIAGIEGEAKVRGGLSYGIGAKAKADFGFSDGSLRAELQLGATFGLGAEFGVSLDLNVQQAVTNVVAAGQDALDWMFRE